MPPTTSYTRAGITIIIRKVKRTRLKPPHPVPSTTTRGGDDVDDVAAAVAVSLVVASVRTNGIVASILCCIPIILLVTGTAVSRQRCVKVLVNNNERNMVAFFSDCIIYIYRATVGCLLFKRTTKEIYRRVNAVQKLQRALENVRCTTASRAIWELLRRYDTVHG